MSRADKPVSDRDPHPVAQICAEWHAAHEIVIALRVIAPSPALRLAFHQDQLQRLTLARATLDGFGLDVRLG
jgi:hypothetical protein